MTESAQAHSETTGFKPVLCGYIEEALSMIQPGKLPGQIVVHDVRVLMKKSRAAIKLIGSSMDEQSFRREYNAFRETGRMMSTWRESTVHRKLLWDFRKRHPAARSRSTRQRSSPSAFASLPGFAGRKKMRHTHPGYNRKSRDLQCANSRDC